MNLSTKRREDVIYILNDDFRNAMGGFIATGNRIHFSPDFFLRATLSPLKP